MLLLQIRDKKLSVRILRLCHRDNSFRNEDWHKYCADKIYHSGVNHCTLSRIGIKNCADKIKRELMYEINRYINSLFKVFYLCIELR